MKQPCVYLLASQRNGTLYIGVTSDLIKRVWQHKQDFVEGFTKQYGVHDLVWYEQHEDMLSAITREKTLKEWKRAWKLELVCWIPAFAGMTAWGSVCPSYRRIPRGIRRRYPSPLKKSQPYPPLPRATTLTPVNQKPHSRHTGERRYPAS